MDTEEASGKTGSASVSSVSSVVVISFFLCALVSAQARIWTIPEGAASEKNPLSPTPAVLKQGESLFKSHCVTCHGPKGLGDGPDVDKKDRANRPANLVLSRNPEGVVFYKIWNGRQDPKMPAFKSQMTKDEVWSVAAYAMSLRP